MQKKEQNPRSPEGQLYSKDSVGFVRCLFICVIVNTFLFIVELD
jgi:hypothetical protein